jgi:DNA polymerase V
MTSREIVLPAPSADTGLLTELLTKAMAQHFNPRASYHRAGVWLQDFIPKYALQTDLVGNLDIESHDQSTRRMSALDTLNTRYGKHTVYFASEDLGNSWQPIRKIQMPRFTTQWDELANARPL